MPTDTVFKAVTRGDDGVTVQSGDESILMSILNDSERTFTTASSCLQQCAQQVREAFIAAVFGEKPADYVPKTPTFNRERPRLPVGTMSFAKDGTTVTGLIEYASRSLIDAEE